MTCLGVRRSVLVGGLVGWSIALIPGRLPHPALLTATAATVVMLIGMAAGALVPTAARPRHRWWIAVAAAPLAASYWWQHRVAGALGFDVPGLGWVVVVAGVPLLVAAAVIGLPGRVWVGGAVLAALTGLPPTAAHAAVPGDPALAYSRLDGSADLDARADELVARWSAGPRTSAVVVAVPTGSGWVDASAIAGFRAQFADDVSFLSLQYSDVPSWQAYLRSPEAAADSAIAVLRALDRELRTVAVRPRVYLFGQSLGAVGADAARAWARTAGVRVAGTILSGPPAGSVVASTPACDRRVIVANATDPVVDTDASVLWRKPERDPGRVGARGVDPPWVPGLSFIGSVLDLAVSLDGPVGTGHHYGTEQGLAVSELPAGCQAIGPRAAS